jgi:multiple sugar transport system substrate-binding protein
MNATVRRLEQMAGIRHAITRRTALRHLSAIPCRGIGAGLLALACGRPAGRREETGTAPAPATITFLGRESGSEVPVYEQGIARFQELQPRVKVTREVAAGNFDEKLRAAVAGGAAPDVFYMHSQTVPTYVAWGVAGSLERFAAKDRAVFDGLLPAAVDAYRFRGAVYGIPDVATSYVMYVNRDLFGRAGAAIPGERWSWDDYLATARQIRTALQADQGFATVNYTAGDSWPAVLWQNDADILSQDRTAVTVDRPEAIDAFSWIADQIHRLRVHAAPADLGNRNAEQFFLDGKAAILPTYSSRMGIIARGAAFEVEVVHLPAGRRRVTRTAAGGTGMYRESRAAEACWEFLKFVASEEFQWMMARVSGIIFPAHKNVAGSPDLFTGGPFPKSPKVTVDAMAYARTEPYIVRYVELKNALIQELNAAWRGDTGVKEALQRARAAMEPILAEALKEMR